MMEVWVNFHILENPRE